MSLTFLEYALLTELRKAKLLPHRPHILELGEANWYGDVPLAQLAHDIRQFVAETDRREQLLNRLRILAETNPPEAMFDIAKIFYAAFFDYESIAAIDFHGTAFAQQLDLNHPILLDKKYHLVINDGTGEHIFNIGQFFRTMHEATIPGGIMYHHAPFTGWFDHGFYNINPTLFFDLAEANQYQLLGLVYGELQQQSLVQIHSREQLSAMARAGKFAANSVLCCLFGKPMDEREFRFPMQGYYANTVSEESKNAWRELR